MPQWTAGKLGGGVDFGSNTGKTTASGGWLDFGTLKNFNISGERTPHAITAWLYIPQVIGTGGSQRQWGLILGTPGNGAHHWLFGGTVSSQYGVRSGPQIRKPYQVGQWMFLAISYDGKNLTGNIDGTFITDTVFSPTSPYFNLKSSSFQIGKGFSNSPFTGIIDEVRVYERNLTRDEMQQIYEATK